MLLWHVCGEEVRHLPFANKSVLGYREVQPMAGSRVYLPFGQPLADSRSRSAMPPNLRANIPNPSVSAHSDLHDCPKVATGLQQSCASKPTNPTNPDRPSTCYKPPKPFQYLTHLQQRQQATTRGHLSFRLHATRAAWSEGSASVSPSMSSRAFRPSNGIPFLHTGATSSSGPQKLNMRLAR